MNENISAYCVLCFAHQLQLALVVVAKNHSKMDVVFTVAANIYNVSEILLNIGIFFEKHKLKRFLNDLKVMNSKLIEV